MKLTEHFSFKELTDSEIAARHGIDNIPTSPLVLTNLKTLAEGLERVRTLLGQPITVLSGYRSLMVNTLLGSKSTSQHIKGLAADIISPSFGSPKAIVDKIIKSDIPYDQLIWEFENWVHISFCEEGYKSRKQVLTIDKKGTRNYDTKG
jgi:hypothetical protein